MRLIDADKLIQDHFSDDDNNLSLWIRMLIINAPAVDAAPVIHSYWIEYPRAHYFKCANCKYTVPYKKACLHNGKRE